MAEMYSDSLKEILWANSSMALGDELAQGADQFSDQLRQIAVLVNAEISTAIRKGVLDVFRNIIKRSPVDTGAYRASHGIANMEPAKNEDVVKGKKGQVIDASVALAKLANWTWKVGDGDIYIFNNLPYAERIENGWSKKAPAGCYRVALAEMVQFLNKELAKLKTVDPMGGI